MKQCKNKRLKQTPEQRKEIKTQAEGGREVYIPGEIQNATFREEKAKVEDLKGGIEMKYLGNRESGSRGRGGGGMEESSRRMQR